MAISYKETDTATVCANVVSDFCSTNTVTANLSRSQTRAIEGGTAGTAVTVGLNSAETGKRNLIFEISPGSDTLWDAGTWTIRLNVTTANANLTWRSVFMCHVSSGCGANLATIVGNDNNVAQGLGTTGVKSVTLTLGVARGASSGDLVVVSTDMTNGVHSAQTVGITRDQNIDTPFNHMYHEQFMDLLPSALLGYYIDQVRKKAQFQFPLLRQLGQSFSQSLAGTLSFSGTITTVLSNLGLWMAAINPGIDRAARIAALAAWRLEDAMKKPARRVRYVYEKAVALTQQSLAGSLSFVGTLATSATNLAGWMAAIMPGYGLAARIAVRRADLRFRGPSQLLRQLANQFSQSLAGTLSFVGTLSTVQTFIGQIIAAILSGYQTASQTAIGFRQFAIQRLKIVRHLPDRFSLVFAQANAGTLSFTGTLTTVQTLVAWLMAAINPGYAHAPRIATRIPDRRYPRPGQLLRQIGNQFTQALAGTLSFIGTLATSQFLVAWILAAIRPAADATIRIADVASMQIRSTFERFPRIRNTLDALMGFVAMAISTAGNRTRTFFRESHGRAITREPGSGQDIRR